MNVAGARRRRKCMGDVSNTFALAQPLVVAKNKYLVFPDGPAGGRAELVAAKRRFGQAVVIFKEVGCVQGAVADELIGAAVELAGAGAGDGIDDPAGGEAVLSGVVACQNREFLDGVNPRFWPSTLPGPALE